MILREKFRRQKNSAHTQTLDLEASFSPEIWMSELCKNCRHVKKTARTHKLLTLKPAFRLKYGCQNYAKIVDTFTFGETG
jgi:hypothetical protein